MQLIHYIYLLLKVVAVEPQWEAVRRLATSVYLGNVTDGRLVLLHNAVTNETGSVIDLDVNRNNRGGTHIRPLVMCKNRFPRIRNPRKYPSECQAAAARSIILDDLLPLIFNASWLSHRNDQRFGRPQVVIKVYRHAVVMRFFVW